MTDDPPLSARLLNIALEQRAQTVPNAHGYVGRAISVPTKPDGSVEPYWVLHASPGGPADEVDLGDTGLEVDCTFQITCVAGNPDAVLALADRVHACFYRWEPEAAGGVYGGCRPPPGYEPQVLVDDDVSPPRYFVPLQYRTTATTTSST